MKKKMTKFLLVWSLGKRTAFRMQHIRRRLDTSGKLDGPNRLWDQETRDCDKINQIENLGDSRMWASGATLGCGSEDPSGFSV